MSEQVVAIDAELLASWLAKQGPDVHWSVDGERILQGQLSFPCTGAALANALRKHGGRLLAVAPDESVKTNGDPGLLVVKDSWGGRVFQLAWESNPGRRWLVIEDIEEQPAVVASR